MNKSETIRKYLGKYPDKGPTELAALIREKEGVEVTPGFVTTVKGTEARKSSNSSGVLPTPTPPAPPYPHDDFFQALAELKRLVRVLGGPEAAKDAIDLVSRPF